jgi:hypothetical protein
VSDRGTGMLSRAMAARRRHGFGEQFLAAGGELLVCPICFNARKLDEGRVVANARIAGATPLWKWIGDSYGLQLLRGGERWQSTWR